MIDEDQNFNDQQPVACYLFFPVLQAKMRR
jgi:hypothetical protein